MLMFVRTSGAEQNPLRLESIRRVTRREAYILRRAAAQGVRSFRPDQPPSEGGDPSFAGTEESAGTGSVAS